MRAPRDFTCFAEKGSKENVGANEDFGCQQGAADYQVGMKPAPGHNPDPEDVRSC